jgi:two-component system cell cycle sensor histidine kinase/response regulator CckA
MIDDLKVSTVGIDSSPRRANVTVRSSRSSGKSESRPEVILLVDDDDLVRTVVRRILEKRGYVILEASGGREGLECCRGHLEAIDLLLTDVVMPEMGGCQLAEGAVKLRPGLRVMFMSALTPRQESALSEKPFLQKPFTLLGLTQKVREVLDS